MKVSVFSILSVLTVFSTVASFGDPTPSRGALPVQRAVHDGVAVELEMIAAHDEPRGLAPRPGDSVRFRFQISDEATGTPLSGLFPAAWVDRHPRVQVQDTTTCQDKIEAFIGGGLLAAPEIDLNVYFVLALNDDATVTVVDPLFGFGTTKLLAMVFLPAPGLDWVLNADQTFLYVSMPEAGQVAKIDTGTWKVRETFDVGGPPGRIVLQADGHYLWVALEGKGPSAGVVAIDTDTPRKVIHIATGQGPHDLSLSGDDRHLLVTNGGDGSLSIIDVSTLSEVAELAVGERPVSLAYSPKANVAFVVDADGGIITAVDPERQAVVTRIEAEPGLGRIRFAPDGRLAFVVNPDADQVHILDASLNRIVQTADVLDGPDQVSFSDHLAYIRHRGSETVLMIPLDQVGTAGRPVPVIDFPGGQQPFGRGRSPSLGDGIVQAPGATAVLVANPADRAIYFYKEGMAAPMGQFQNYGRQPRAVQVVDRSLREIEPGVYETLAPWPRPGRYDIAFFLGAPRTLHCFAVEVVGVADAAGTGKVRVEPQPVETENRLGATVELRFRLTDAATGKPRDGLDDVRVLTFRTPGRGRRHHPARGLGGGLYQAEMVPTDIGLYYAFVESREAGVASTHGRFLSFRVTEP